MAETTPASETSRTLADDASSASRTVAIRTYDALRAQLVTGALAAHRRLSVRALAADLNVSRTPVHDALTRLEGEHMVSRLPTGEFAVRTLAPDEVRGLYACREMLESLAVRLAVERATDEELSELRTCIDEAGRAYVRGEPEAIAKWNRRFHRRLVDAAKNDWVGHSMTPLQAHVDRLRFALVNETYRPVFVPEHQAILDALEARDAEQAEQAVRLHAASVLSRIPLRAEEGHVMRPVATHQRPPEVRA